MEARSSSSSRDGNGMHFVICPWLAFGHLLPCLELAHRLASRGHRVSFVSTPRNLSRLPPLSSVHFVPLSLPHFPGLLDGAESTSDIPDDKAALHLMASDGLAAPFSKFLAASKPDWVIVDTVNHWAAAAAEEHKVPCAGLLLCAATLLTPWAGRLSHNDDYWKQTYTTAPKVPAGMSVSERCLATLQRCKIVGLRSCVEWEPEAVRLVKNYPGTTAPVVALGLLPPSVHKDEDKDKEATLVKVRGWLDAQPAKSVVYVALGSEAPLRDEQLVEMALGLELAGARFLWALRKGDLPPGFEERTRDRGLVVIGWVPQLSVLAHGAVAAFLTHCGWSSTIEGMMFGRPLVMLPIATGDQWSNARFMEKRGVGVQVPRDENDGSFDKEGLAAAVRTVMEDQQGTFAANASKLQQIVADKDGHERYIDGFIDQLISYMEE